MEKLNAGCTSPKNSLPGTGLSCTSKETLQQTPPPYPSQGAALAHAPGASPIRGIAPNPHFAVQTPAASNNLHKMLRETTREDEQMFSCARDSGWERHVAVAVVGEGEPLGSACPPICVLGEDAAWRFFCFQGCSWARQEAWKCPIRCRIALFS